MGRLTAFQSWSRALEPRTVTLGEWARSHVLNLIQSRGLSMGPAACKECCSFTVLDNPVTNDESDFL